MGSAPTLNSLHLNHDQAYQGDQTSGKGRTNWSPTRESQENAAKPTSADSQPEAGGLFNSPEQAASRQVTSSLNAPAAIYARTLASDSNRTAIRADFTISAPHSPATLAVRTVSDEGWNPNSQFRNPLRGRPAVSRVAFEMSDVSTEEIPVNPLGATAKPFEAADFEAPNNPLR
jgi:hypothetical protein